MSDQMKTLLPPTATPLAKVLDLIEERLFGLPVQAVTKDPQNVDAAWLDLLAWEHSVEVWDLAWPETVKRDVIAASDEVHRYKGTPHAVRRMLASFGLGADLSEWFEPGGEGLPPGGYRISFRQSGVGEFGPLDRKTLDVVRRSVLSVAPVSRAMEYRVVQEVRTTVSAHLGQYETGRDAAPTAFGAPTYQHSASLAIAAGSRAHSVDRAPVQFEGTS